jgi:hypothetical protein
MVNPEVNDEERKSRSSIRIEKRPQTTIPRVDSPVNSLRSSTPNNITISAAKKNALKTQVELEIKLAEAEEKKALAEAKKAEAVVKKAELKAQKETEKAEKKKEREEKKKAYENNHNCITLRINGVDDNPSETIRQFYGNFVHFPVSKISGVSLKDVIFLT